MDVFNEEVYSIVEQIPQGKVITYGLIARLMGLPNLSRRVGRAMKQIPEGRIVPAHRVVNSEGRLAPGWPGQKELLLAEGVIFRSNGYVNMEKSLWEELKD